MPWLSLFFCIFLKKTTCVAQEANLQLPSDPSVTRDDGGVFRRIPARVAVRSNGVERNRPDIESGRAPLLKGRRVRSNAQTSGNT